MEHQKIAQPLHSASNKQFHRKPFPYFKSDDFLTPSVFEAVKRYWPGREFFDQMEFTRSKLALDHVLPKLGNESREFWKWFAKEVVTQAGKKVIEEFSPWIYARLGHDLKTVNVGIPDLFDCTGDVLGPHETHFHHRRDPYFLATFLIYVDDHGELGRGTSFYSFDGNSDSPREVSKYCSDEQNFIEKSKLSIAETAEFRENRLLAFYESPISFHGVEDLRPFGAGGPRAQIRVHISAEGFDFKKHYGVSSLQEYLKFSVERNNSWRFRRWLKRDLNLFKRGNQAQAFESEVRAWQAGLHYLSPRLPN